MAEPLYVPVLPVREHARLAYQDVRSGVQAAMAPLWNVPPCSDLPPAELVTTPWKKQLDRMWGSCHDHPGWVDAPFAEKAHIPALSEIFAKDADFLAPPCPVTGPERSEAQKAAALETARHHGGGLGLRVCVPGEWDSRAAEAAQRLLVHVEREMPVDLLLDLGSVLPGRPDASKEALRALDALWPLADWRVAAVLGGGCPRLADDDVPRFGQLHEEPRSDWGMWHEMQMSGRDYLAELVYGDYGVQPVSSLANESDGGRPPWGVLAYTTDDWFVLCKVSNLEPDRVAGIRAAARLLRDLPEFRGAAASTGETWLHNCAGGPVTVGKGAGQPQHWLRAGNTQHMTHVVRSLQRR
ncbi:beta family protein [Streptomyces johnsoniae]|uniref:Beta family protein n=1 Tax=Streptomyces johnsoniae TaxID=3075532 RepID=A0ABU2S489_9ACTN|nr:beta family protein [Streptomyces sp. DSM 41886]MDT0442865.1 beta family protein [Streptomyces sp. DSM 41886]